MNLRISCATLLALGCGVALAVPAMAAAAGQTAAPASATTAAAPGGTTTSTAMARRSVPLVDSRTCLRSTGSHIKPAKGQCLPVHGSSYSRQDLERTGEMNVGQALQRLDPTVSAGPGRPL